MNTKMHVNCHCGNCELVRTQHDDELVKATLECAANLAGNYIVMLVLEPSIPCAQPSLRDQITALTPADVAAWRSAKEGKGGK